MMLEETLIRENATKKLQKRNVGQAVVVGPPVTLANPVSDRKKVSSPTNEDSELFEMNVVGAAADGGNSDSSEIVSPANVGRQSSSFSFKDFVPREQYDALKAKFIDNETAAKKRLESIGDLEAQIRRRED